MDAAPIGQRIAAGLIDAGFGLSTLAGIGVIGWKLRVRLHRFTEPIEHRLRPHLRELVDRGALTPAQRLFFKLVSLIAALIGRNSRSPGAQAMGLRKVELLTGKPVSIRAAIIQLVARSVQSAALGRLFRPLERRRKGRLETLEADLRRLHRVHQDAKK